MWDDFDAKAPDGRAEQLDAKRQALKESCQALATDDRYTPLRKHLSALLEGASYSPGRSAEEVAFCEGQRHVARLIMGSKP
jgi:hypothetical protein